MGSLPFRSCCLTRNNPVLQEGCIVAAPTLAASIKCFGNDIGRNESDFDMSDLMRCIAIMNSAISRTPRWWVSTRSLQHDEGLYLKGANHICASVSIGNRETSKTSLALLPGMKPSIGAERRNTFWNLCRETSSNGGTKLISRNGSIFSGKMISSPSNKGNGGAAKIS